MSRLVFCFWQSVWHNDLGIPVRLHKYYAVSSMGIFFQWTWYYSTNCKCWVILCRMLVLGHQTYLELLDTNIFKIFFSLILMFRLDHTITSLLMMDLKLMKCTEDSANCLKASYHEVYPCSSIIYKILIILISIIWLWIMNLLFSNSIETVHLRSSFCKLEIKKRVYYFKNHI